MKKYSYPAIFTPEENGAYSIHFPDLESCYTCGDSLADGIMMAEDVLAFVLYDYEKQQKTIPLPSSPQNLILNPGEFVNYIACDTLAYRKRFSDEPVKKTLTIPKWLNEAAIDRGLNFSLILQEALMAKIKG